MGDAPFAPLIAPFSRKRQMALQRVPAGVQWNEIEVTIKVPEQLAAEARTRGVSVEVYVQEILARQTFHTSGEERLQSVRSAIDRILELRKGNKLAGLRTKDLIHEGHHY